MMNNRNPLASAIHFALGASVVAGMAMAAAPAWAQDEEGSETQDRIQVTGTRILRDDIDGSLPVQIIDRVSIEASGKTSVADLLRNQPINSAGSFRPQSGSTGQSAATLSLRALGAGRTLILIDGRRAPTAPNLGSGQDLNSIPLAAVERIEILTDGASAIYGSDAIGGVVNIITRSDFTGAQVMMGVSDPKRPGGETREASAIFGAASADGQIMAGVSNNKRDIIFQRDREWSRDGFSVFSNNFARATAPNAGAFLGTVPGDGCVGEGFFVAGGLCRYDFTLLAADEAEIENQSMFVRARYDVNMDWSLHMNSSIARVKSFGRYAPVPSSPWLVSPRSGARGPLLAPGSPNHPATPPEQGGLNPDWELYQAFADLPLENPHRFATAGPRDTTTDSTVYDLDAFVSGRIGDFDVEFGARRVESRYSDRGENYIVAGLAQQAWDSGAYNIYDIANVPQSVIDSFTATIGRDGRFVSSDYRAILSGDLFEMAAGPVGFAIGAEYRKEEFSDIFDSLSENGQITGSAGASSSGGRSQWAAYGELLFPLADNFELSVAGRYDDYSDFGNKLSPKLAMRWDPTDQIGLRASWGEGFRAPQLDILNQSPSFSAAFVIDPITATFLGNTNPFGAIQVTSFGIANPDLEEEESEQWSAGVVFEPGGWFNASVDYWNIKVTNRVQNVGANTILACLRGTTVNCPPGLSVFPTGSGIPDSSFGLGAEFGADGEAVTVQTGFISLGTIETDGFDIAMRGNFDFGDWGNLRSEIRGNYTLSFITDEGNNVAGLVSLPRWRAVWSNQHFFGDFSAAWNINYIGGQRRSGTSTLDPLPSWTTHDIQFNYFTPWNGQISVGFDNLLDKDPVLDVNEGRGFNFGLYNGYGRIAYLRYVQNF